MQLRAVRGDIGTNFTRKSERVCHALVNPDCPMCNALRNAGTLEVKYGFDRHCLSTFSLSESHYAVCTLSKLRHPCVDEPYFCRIDRENPCEIKLFG